MRRKTNLYLDGRHRGRRGVGEVGEERVEVVESGLAELLQYVVGVVRVRLRQTHDVADLCLRELAQ